LCSFLRACSRSSQLWALCTLFLQFSPLSEILDNESSGLHAYLITAIVTLLAYLAAGLHHGLALFLYVYQLHDKLSIRGHLLERHDGAVPR
jgi:hypothetical protein